MPTSGTVYEWAYEVSTGDGLYTVVWDISEFSVQASTLSPLILGDDVDTLLAQHLMVGDDTVRGSSGNDGLLGYGGNDTIIGNDGNDFLDGGLGIDDMVGGLGDDTYVLDNANDMISEDADQGTDSVTLQFAPTDGAYVLSANFENLRNLSGQGLVMGGNAGNNQLFGGSGVDDVLYGAGGNDYLNGGTGADAMFGGSGHDTFFVDNTADFVSDRWSDLGATGDGVDEVRTSVSFALVGGDRADIEHVTLIGTAAINATGNALVNELSGNAAANTLNGAAGADVMRGGGGNDVYYVDNGGDRVIETSAAGGADTVRSSVSFELGNNVENLQLTGAVASMGTGNALANRISGNNQLNVLLGEAGDDVLTGNGGQDTLLGGIGDDQIDGGTGEDWVEGGVGKDIVTGGSDADLFVFRSGDFAGLSAGSCDRIIDFSQADGDQIRLNSIDANGANGSTTNEAFSFIGSAAFHGVAGELRYVQNAGNTFVMGDTNGDGAADFMIRLDGLHSLAASDFLL
ncbi:calcium-binding protein [Sphingomonas sabuli]|uniref:Calcium-binding protein n=1 Tax=Sphingomonas sabuli TaxID=2764186 RepID=A0A7G9L2R2_9SPHN|nr:calcium-binding protein [Sphingomonas sabuli]QNM82911.1 calcium-binding protein [Sphingomonas sabuli]